MINCESHFFDLWTCHGTMNIFPEHMSRSEYKKNSSIFEILSQNSWNRYSRTMSTKVEEKSKRKNKYQTNRYINDGFAPGVEYI